MPVGFIADTHDHIQFITHILETCHAEGVEEVVHLGDVCELDTMVRLSREIDTLRWVTGNGDEQRKRDLADIVRGNGGEALGYNERVTYGDARFLVRHGIEHNLSYPMAATDDALDYVMHGHYHYQERTDVGGGEVLNPGAEGMYLYYPETDEFRHVDFDVDNA